MTTFPDLPRMVPGPMQGGERTYNTLESLVMPDGYIVTPFRTDGLSIPKVVQPLLGPHDGRGFAAGLGHDHRYRHSKRTRKEVDQLFRSDLAECGVWWWRRKLIYAGVRIGAGFTWRKYRRAEK